MSGRDLGKTEEIGRPGSQLLNDCHIFNHSGVPESLILKVGRDELITCGISEMEKMNLECRKEQIKRRFIQAITDGRKRKQSLGILKT